MPLQALAEAASRAMLKSQHLALVAAHSPVQTNAINTRVDRNKTKNRDPDHGFIEAHGVW